MENPQLQTWVVQLFQILSDVAVGGAAVVAAVIGWRGYSAWRKELVGKARYEAARAVVRKAFEYKALLSEARQNVDHAHFGEKLKDPPSEDAIVARLHFQQDVVRPRLDAFQQTSKRLQECCWEAEILLGEPQGSLFAEFDDVSSSVIRSSKRYFLFSINDRFNVIGRGGPTQGTLIEPMLIARLKRVAFESDDDPIAPQAATAVANVQKRLRRHLVD